MDNMIKEENPGEIKTARTKLDGVLQNLIEKVEEKSESEDDKEIDSADVDSRESSLSPKKGAFAKPSRKRRRKEEVQSKVAKPSSHMLVMKMFDRSVNLAKFNADTPLYPMCRAWLKNDPYYEKQKPSSNSRSPSPKHNDSSDDDSLQDEKKTPNIYKLPAPDPLPIVDDVEENVRIPVPLSPQKDEFILDTYIHDDTAAPPRDVMLINHMNRWREVRSRWKTAALRNEARYHQSGSILKSIFDQS